MQTLNANYTAFNNLTYKKYIFTFEILGIDIVFSNDSSLTISGKTVKPYFFSLPKSISDEIDVINKQNTISEMEILLQDFQNYVTQFMTDNSVLNKEIRIKQGFKGLAYADFITIYEGKILEYQYNIESISYFYAIGDRLRKLKNPLFADFNYLYRSNKALIDFYSLEVVSPTLTTIETGNITSNVIDGTTVDLNLDFSNSTLQGKIIKITSGTLNGNFYYIDEQILDNQIRITGQFPSGDEPNSESIIIYNLDDFYIQGNIIDFLLYCMEIELGLISYTNFISTGLDYYDYDDRTFTEIKTDYFSGIDIKYFVKEIVKDAKKFYETEFFKLLQIFLFIDNEGHLKLSLTKQPSKTNDLVTFFDNNSTTNNIIGLPKYKTNADKIINQIYLKYDFDESSNEYAKKILYRDNASFFKYGDFPILTIESKVLRSSLSGDVVVESLVDRIFSRFSNPTPEITIRTFSKYNYLEVGDVVVFDSDNIPNFQTGNKKTTALMEIIKKEKNYENNEVSFTLFDTQYTGYATVWGGDEVTYATATDEERATLLFWTDENDEVEDENGNKIKPAGWSE
jgi:hypothetical protein